MAKPKSEPPLILCRQTYLFQSSLLHLTEQSSAHVCRIHHYYRCTDVSAQREEKMTPPCRVFQASQLPAEIQVDDGKRRKGGRIDLSACELLSMVQYDCQIDRPDLSNSPVKCWPVQRWFRRCQDRKGKFLVETTMWEGRASPPDSTDTGTEPRDGSLGDGPGGA